MKSVALLLLLCVIACAAQLGASSAIPQHPLPPPPPHHAANPVAQPPAAHHPAQPQAADNHDAEAVFDLCRQGSDWVRYKDSCFKFFETNQYWYVAEQLCKSHGGHLVSIVDGSENSFVAKLTYCQSAWTGRYSVNADKLREYTNYRWTDASDSGQYHAHDFSKISSVHEPLIAVDNLRWYNRVYHARENYVCKVKSPGGGQPSARCPAGWKYLNQSCYLMPNFPGTNMEATLYCAGRNAHPVSVYSAQELRALSLLDLSSDGCPPEVWIGLVKNKPCRIDMFSGESICYKWMDRVHPEYDGFPAWHPGHPDPGDEAICVVLKDRGIKSVRCHEKHRFICKKPATGA